MTASAQRPMIHPSRVSQTVPAAASECVRKWVQECIELCQPDQVTWLDGSESSRSGSELLRRGKDSDLPENGI